MPVFISRRVGVVLCTAILIASASLPGRLMAAPEPTLERHSKDFVEATMDEALVLFTGTAQSEAELEKATSRLIDQRIDLKTMARFSIGSYWNNATEAQQKKYLELFRAFVLQSFMSRFGHYDGEPLLSGDVLQIDAVDQERNAVMVRTRVGRSQGGKLRLDWRLRQSGKTFKIVDLVVKGISMALVQREGLMSVVKMNGGQVQALINVLEERTGNPSDSLASKR